MNNIYKDNNLFNQPSYPFLLSREQSYNYIHNYEESEFKNCFFPNKNNMYVILI